MFLSASVLSNKSLMEEATKCLFRTSVLNGCQIKQAHLAINRRQRKKNERNVDLYSAFTATPPQGAQVWITQFYLHTVEGNGELRTVICVLEARPR